MRFGRSPAHAISLSMMVRIGQGRSCELSNSKALRGALRDHCREFLNLAYFQFQPPSRFDSCFHYCWRKQSVVSKPLGLCLRNMFVVTHTKVWGWASLSRDCGRTEPEAWCCRALRCHSAPGGLPLPWGDDAMHRSRLPHNNLLRLLQSIVRRRSAFLHLGFNDFAHLARVR